MQKLIVAAGLCVLFFYGTVFGASEEIKSAMRLRRQNPDEAAVIFKKVLRESPNSVDGMLAAGMLEVQNGNYKKAKPHFEKVLTKKADSIPANYMLAMINERNENDEQSLIHWRVVEKRAKGNLKELAKKHIEQLETLKETE